jgi:alpha-tubulin suppressor-like RCC1 family protein
LTNVAVVTGGAGHGLALRADGTVAAWGDNSYGQAQVPAGLSNVVALAAGSWHNLAAKSDGSVTAWGAGMADGNPNDPNGFQVGQSIVPTGLTNAVAVAAGFFHSLALRNDGTVIAWGSDSVGQTKVPPGLSNVVAIASGENHCLALKADGTIVSWGHYFAHPATNVPPGLTNIIAIAAGTDSHHSLALKADGALVAWGEDDFYGQLDIPAGLSNVVAIAVGGVHNLALPGDGTVIAWGAGKVVDRSTGGDWGQSIVPANLTNAVAIGAGYIQSLAVVGEVAPFIATPLLDRTIIYGTTTRLRIGATGSPPFTYQWRFNGFDLPGATNAVLELNKFQFDQAGIYSVIVSNAFGTATSREMRLTVAPFFFTVQPQSQVTLAGRTVSFDVAAIGQEPFQYQWQFNGTDLSGETSRTLSVTNVQVDNVGTYAVVVRNALGAVRSIDATLSLTQIAAWGDDRLGQTNVPAGLTNVIAIAAGANHSLALKRDGGVVAWGDDYFGQASVPVALTNVAAIAAAGHYNVALKRDGTLIAWGINSLGQANVPTGLTSVVAIAAGSTHGLALKMDGTVAAWGTNFNPQVFGDYFPARPPAGLADVAAIAAGENFSLALKGDGTVVAWGSKDFVRTNIPAGLAHVVAIAAGESHCVALRADGTVFAWGDNLYGQANVPPGLTNVTAIAAGESHSVALRVDGTVVAWGAGDTNGTGFPPRPRPPIGGASYGQSDVPSDVTNVTAIAAGNNHNLALIGNGPPIITSPLADRSAAHGTTAYLRVAAVGALPFTYQWRFNGVDLPGATNAVLELNNLQFSQAGSYSVVVRNAFGAATSTGMTLGIVAFFITAHPQDQNTYRGATVRLSVAASGQGAFNYQWRYNDADLTGATGRVLELTNVRTDQSGMYSVNVGNAVGLVRSDSAKVSIGQVITWGEGAFGQTNLPPDLTNVVLVAGGGRHSLALKADGTVVAWGENVWGATTVPAVLSNVVAIAAGGRHSLALQANGTAVFWGEESNNQIPRPSRVTNAVAIAAGAFHSLVLRADRTVLAWGYNSDGQARVPIGLTNVTAIAAGGYHNLALKSDGTVAAWGAAGVGEGRAPPGLSNVVAIAAGGMHSMALKADGTVFAWGRNDYGQTTTPPNLANVIAIAAGGFQSLALRDDGTLITWGDNSLGQLNVPSAATNVVGIASGSVHSLALVDSVWPLTSIIGSPETSTQGIYFRQTGLMNHVVRVFNRNSIAFPAVRLIIHGLTPDATVYNASGTNSQGQPYVQYNQTLEPGAAIDMTIEYHVPSRSIPTTTLTGEVVPAAMPPSPVGAAQAVTRSLRLEDKSYLIDFRTLINRTYYIQYSGDLVSWKTAYPAVIGTGNGLQWVDNGPPKTESNPSTQPDRFYRVLLAP